MCHTHWIFFATLVAVALGTLPKTPRFFELLLCKLVNLMGPKSNASQFSLPFVWFERVDDAESDITRLPVTSSADDQIYVAGAAGAVL